MKVEVGLEEGERPKELFGGREGERKLKSYEKD